MTELRSSRRIRWQYKEDVLEDELLVLDVPDDALLVPELRILAYHLKE
jgi:hypothetical protein